MKMPKSVLVYVCDYDKDGTPILAVETDVRNIAAESDGEKVGIYTLNRVAIFKVKRELR